jgi:hypothetical protein
MASSRARFVPEEIATTSNAEGIEGMAATRALSGRGTPASVSAAARSSKASRSAPSRMSGSALRSNSTPGAWRAAVAAMSIGSAHSLTSHRVALSTRRRPSISISSCTAASTRLSRSSTSPQKERIANTSRPTANPRARLAGAAPVSSPRRKAKVVPALSTSWLATTVAMISRRSR